MAEGSAPHTPHCQRHNETLAMTFVSNLGNLFPDLFFLICVGVWVFWGGRGRLLRFQKQGKQFRLSSPAFSQASPWTAQ